LTRVVLGFAAAAQATVLVAFLLSLGGVFLWAVGRLAASFRL